MDLSNKTALVYDYGICIEHALRLARDFKQVYYYVPWQDAFPRYIEGIIGRGYEPENLYRILNFWDYVDKVDIIVFFDTFCGDLVNYLRDKGYKVFGVGKEEILENDRWYARKIQKKVGLNTQETIKIIGLNNLKLYLQDKTNKIVKLNTFRGSLETFAHIDYKSSQPLLDHLAIELGILQDDIEFIVEDKVGIIEPGYDGYVVNGQFPEYGLWGYELKGTGYIAKVEQYQNMPFQVKNINDKLSPVLQRYKSTTLFSTEIRVDNEGKEYLIDNCIRASLPVPSAIELELYENFSEIIYQGANGILIEPKIDPEHIYVGGLSLESSWAENHWLEINLPENLRKFIKLRKHIKKDDRFYAIPGFSSLCAVIGMSNDFDNLIAQIKERAEQVNAYQVDKNFSGLDILKETIKKGEILGLKFLG